jgi:hypothetical protein
MCLAMRVTEKLRTSLIRFVGVDGLTALLRRSLALARADISLLQTARITADGRLEEVDEAVKDDEAAMAITAHLLGLLVTLIGEPLTLRLTRDAFPEAGQMIQESKDL